MGMRYDSEGIKPGHVHPFRLDAELDVEDRWDVPAEAAFSP
jgi:hypothetical protein